MKFDEEKADEYIESTRPQFIHPACYGMMLEAMRWQYEQDKDLLDRAMKLLEYYHRVLGDLAKDAQKNEAAALLSECRGEA